MASSPTTRSWDNRFCLLLDEHPFISRQLLLSQDWRGCLLVLRARDLLWSYGVLAEVGPLRRALIDLQVLLLRWLRGRAF